MAASKQASIHTHFCNAVTLVWGSLRLAPIIQATIYLNSNHIMIVLLKVHRHLEVCFIILLYISKITYCTLQVCCQKETDSGVSVVDSSLFNKP